VNVVLLSTQGREPVDSRKYREMAKSKRSPVLDSGNYRHGFTVTETKMLRAGTYLLLVSTFDAGELGSFVVTISSSDKILNIRSIP
jgi:calpain-7